MQDLLSFLRGFLYAIKGFFWIIVHERNFRVHLTCLGYMVYFLGRYDYFVLTRTEVAILIIAAAMVLGSEMINTGIEKADDAVSCDKNHSIKVSKDVAAGAVLVFAVASVFVGVALLWQPEAFGMLFDHFADKPICLVSFILSLVLAVLFIFRFDVKYFKKAKKENK